MGHGTLYKLTNLQLHEMFLVLSYFVPRTVTLYQSSELSEEHVRDEFFAIFLRPEKVGVQKTIFNSVMCFGVGFKTNDTWVFSTSVDEFQQIFFCFVFTEQIFQLFMVI